MALPDFLALLDPLLPVRPLTPPEEQRLYRFSCWESGFVTAYVSQSFDGQVAFNAIRTRLRAFGVMATERATLAPAVICPSIRAAVLWAYTLGLLRKQKGFVEADLPDVLNAFRGRAGHDGISIPTDEGYEAMWALQLRPGGGNWLDEPEQWATLMPRFTTE